MWLGHWSSDGQSRSQANGRGIEHPTLLVLGSGRRQAECKLPCIRDQNVMITRQGLGGSRIGLITIAMAMVVAPPATAAFSAVVNSRTFGITHFSGLVFMTEVLPLRGLTSNTAVTRNFSLFPKKH